MRQQETVVFSDLSAKKTLMDAIKSRLDSISDFFMQIVCYPNVDFTFKALQMR